MKNTTSEEATSSFLYVVLLSLADCKLKHSNNHHSLECWQVDGVQFRVHSHFFERESEFFRNLLMGPTSPGYDEDRLDNGDYRLEDVESGDFATFLWVFYNP
jgi:hypothetical protein